jgi:hypothetical protein
MAGLLTDRYRDRLAGDRGIRVFDYPTQFAAPLRDRVREAAVRLAAAAGITIRAHRQELYP